MEIKWVQLIVAKDALGKSYLCKAPFDTVKPSDEVIVPCSDGIGSVRLKVVMEINFCDQDKAEEVIKAAFGTLKEVPAVQKLFCGYEVKFKGDELDV